MVDRHVPRLRRRKDHEHDDLKVRASSRGRAVTPGGSREALLLLTELHFGGLFYGRNTHTHTLDVLLMASGVRPGHSGLSAGRLGSPL